jgi:hypothetical protein
MVSGRYVAPSFFQYAAPLLQGYLGKKELGKVEDRQLDMAKRLREQGVQETQRLMNLIGGRTATPEQVTEMAGPYTDNVPMPTAYMAAQPAIEVNPRLAYAEALNMQSPQARALLPQIAAEAFKKPEAFTLPEGSIRFQTMPDGTVRQVATGGDKTSSEYKDYLLASKDPISPFKGSFVDYQTMIKKAGATSINMPSGEERKAGFMSTILDRNLLQMQTALGIDPTAVKPNVPASIVEAITGPNLLSRNMKPAQRQIVEDSQLDVLDAALTLRTGAAYTPIQLNAMRETYFPVLGDKPSVITAKKQRLESLLEGAYINAGRAVPPRISAPLAPAPATPSAREQLNIPKVNAPVITTPKFLGFEDANR